MYYCDNKKIGKYVRDLIDKRYPEMKFFCEAYLKLVNGQVDDKEKLHNCVNRISQICRGKNSIQTYDLPIFSELLDVSIEEILSGGRSFVPIAGHLTNYKVAHSHDVEKWERYIHHPDAPIMNADEYNKTVIDYALHFKNYKFMKYLLENKYIWFVNPDREDWCDTFGADTKIKPQPHKEEMKYRLKEQDDLRIKMILLAIKNKDTDVLDELKAREFPFMYNWNYFFNNKNNLQENDELVKGVAKANYEMLDYFSEEFEVVNMQNRSNMYLFPYLDEVVNVMIKNKAQSKSIELLLRRILKHNKATFEKLEELINRAYTKELTKIDESILDDEYKEFVLRNVTGDLNFKENGKVVSYYYCENNEPKYVGIVTDIFEIKATSCDALINELIGEINEYYKKIKELKK